MIRSTITRDRIICCLPWCLTGSRGSGRPGIGHHADSDTVEQSLNGTQFVVEPEHPGNRVTFSHERIYVRPPRFPLMGSSASALRLFIRDAGTCRYSIRLTVTSAFEEPSTPRYAMSQVDSFRPKGTLYTNRRTSRKGQKREKCDV